VTNETFSQLPPNSTGDRVRALSLDVVQPDGSTATVKMQVVSVADADGRLLEFPDDWRSAVLEQLSRTNDLLTALLGAIA